MKKTVKTLLAAVLALGFCLPAAARHGAQGQGRQSVAATVAVDTGAVVAYSDTTATDTAAYGAGTNATGTGVSRHYSFSIDDVTDPFNLIAYLATIGAGGVVVAIFFVILCLLVVFSPVILLVVILVMVSKRRSERYKVVEKAMETGRPVPDDIRPSVFDSKELLWRKGIHAFKNASLQEITDRLGFYYHTRIIIRNSAAAAVRYSGKFRQEEGVYEILRLLRQVQNFSLSRDNSSGTIYID